jgi:hypothetical protein
VTAPSTCTISGYLRDITGAPRKGVPVVIRGRTSLMTDGGESWISSGRVTFTSDREGFVSFALIQGADVYVDLPGRHDLKLVRTVPARDAIDLVAWLFPYIVEVLAFDPDAVQIAVGEEYAFRYDVLLSDGTSLLCPDENLTVESGDPEVAEWTGSRLVGVSPGGTTLTVTAVDPSFLPTNLTTGGEVLMHTSLPEIVFPDAHTIDVV